MVSIIILSYNTKSLLRQCLKAIFSLVHSHPFEVIVFDNSSKDDSVSMVIKEFPKVNLIQSKENIGFAKGVNTATKKAKGSHLLFLNSDAALENDQLQDMVEKMEKDQTIGVVGGNLLQNDLATSEAFGSFYNLPEVFRLLFLGKKSRPNITNEFSKVDWVSGGYMLVSKSAFESVGGFDEGFFMYIEDMEFCFRLKQKGYGIYYYQTAKARHVGQGSSNRTFAVINIYKGLLYFYKKHKSHWEYFVVQLLLVTKAFAGLLVGFLTGNKYLYQTYLQALKVTL